eukprot:1808742-Prymnesium_polylepis.2
MERIGAIGVSNGRVALNVTHPLVKVAPPPLNVAPATAEKTVRRQLQMSGEHAWGARVWSRVRSSWLRGAHLHSEVPKPSAHQTLAASCRARHPAPSHNLLSTAAARCGRLAAAAARRCRGIDSKPCRRAPLPSMS